MRDNLLQLIFQTWDDLGMIGWDRQGRLCYLSQGFSGLFPSIDAAPGDSISALWEKLRARCRFDPGAFETAFAARTELEIAVSDAGAIHWFRCTLHSGTEADAQQVMLVRDVTPVRLARRASRALAAGGEPDQTRPAAVPRADAAGDPRLSERRLSSLFKAAPIGIGTVKDRVLQSVNPRLCEMLGYAESELIGRNSRLLYCSDAEYARVGRDKYAMLRAHGLGQVETRFKRKDGSRLDVWLSSTWLDPSQPEHGATFTVMDITERKHQEAALRDSEQRARALLEAMPDLMFRLDRNGLYLDYKAEREDLLAQEQPNLIGLRLQDIAPPAFSARILGKIAQTLNSGKLQEFEYSLDIPGRGTREWEARMVPSGSDEVIVTVRDITQRKAAAMRLHTLSRVVEQSPDAIMLTDAEFRITYLNPAFEWLFGYSLADLQGKTPDLLNAEPEAAAQQQRVYDSLMRGSEFFDTALNRRKDGTLFHCQFWVSPLRDEQERISGYMGSQRDITAQKQAQAALRQSEERYRTLYEQIPQGVILHDADGSIITANPAALQILGRRQDELCGRTLEAMGWRGIHEDGSEFPLPEHPVRIAQRTRIAVKNVVMGVFNPRRQDDVWLNLDAVPLPASGTTESGWVFASFSDITEARNLQQALIQNQKMEAIGRLTGGIAHDFNNILGSILGFAELASLHPAGQDPKLREYLAQIAIAGRRARDLVRQLLVFSRGDSTGGAKPSPLLPMVKEVMKLLRPSLPASMQIRLQLPESSPVVEIDPLHTQQLLMNLCLNARDAMHETGVLTVEVSTVRVKDEYCALCRHRVNGEWVELRVSDTGCGIPPLDRDLIFQPFFTTKSIGMGSGMGLAVVSGLIKTYQGHVLVHSPRGQGTTIRLLLPPAEPADTAVTQTADAQSPQRLPRNIRVLVVDDETAIREYLSRILSRSGIPVVACADSGSALEAHRSANPPFDLIITDLTMPGITGLELARRIRDLDERVKIVVCSGYDHVITEAESGALKIGGVLLKPFDTIELLGVIERVFKQGNGE